MKKIIMLIVSTLLLNSIVFAANECPIYGTHDFKQLLTCSLIKTCDCGAVEGEHEFVDGKCTECETLESEESEDGKCPECGNDMTEYTENGITGYRCSGCNYWSTGSSAGNCSECDSVLEWVAVDNVGAFICRNCNELQGSVGACKNCGAVVTPEIVRGYVVFNCCGEIDTSIAIEVLGIEQCSKDSKVEGHNWKVTKTGEGKVQSYYIVCIDCSRIIESFDMQTTQTSSGETERVPVTNDDYGMLTCVCGGTTANPDNWNYSGWNVTNEIHYVTCNACGGVQRSGPHDFSKNGISCDSCGIKKQEIYDDEFCSCGGKEALPNNPNGGWYAGMTVSATHHYSVCSECGKYKFYVEHNFVMGKCTGCTMSLEEKREVCQHTDDLLYREYNYSPEIPASGEMHYYRIRCKCGYIVSTNKIEEKCSGVNCVCAGKNTFGNPSTTPTQREPIQDLDNPTINPQDGGKVINDGLKYDSINIDLLYKDLTPEQIDVLKRDAAAYGISEIFLLGSILTESGGEFNITDKDWNGSAGGFFGLTYFPTLAQGSIAQQWMLDSLNDTAKGKTDYVFDEQTDVLNPNDVNTNIMMGTTFWRGNIDEADGDMIDAIRQYAGYNSAAYDGYTEAQKDMLAQTYYEYSMIAAQMTIAGKGYMLPGVGNYRSWLENPDSNASVQAFMDEAKNLGITVPNNPNDIIYY